MIVVADSSPLHYLILIDQIHVLPTLYSQIMIPPAVRMEVSAPQAPAPVRLWLMKLPNWVEIVHVRGAVEAALSHLGAGEREALMLARQLNADAILVDDREARKEAERSNLRTIGTLAILVDAAERGLIDLVEAVEALRRTSFRASPQLLKTILDRHGKA